jgi:hypothetical protein
VQVDAAERRENLKTCLEGIYASLCKHTPLSQDERLKVAEAERMANLKTCLAGRYESLCDHSKLSLEEMSRVRQAERDEIASKKRNPKNQRQTASAKRACEDGHSIDSVSADGEVIILENGSVWGVDSINTVKSSLWLPASSILICDGRLVNTDDDEVVSAEKISGNPSSSGTRSRRRYEVQASIDDETFVINDEVFKAQTYCFGISKGDEVVFVEGSTNGSCTSATFVVLHNSRKCVVWCE